MSENSTISNTILMVRPANFGYNSETAQNNSFQTQDDSLTNEEISKRAISEFDSMVDELKRIGINVLVIEDTDTPIKPDAIFPNNWFSTHAQGAVVTYPMQAISRRAEKRNDIIELLNQEYGYSRLYTFDYMEEQDQFLEGTGSMILDRKNKILYACLSVRTEIRVLDKFCVLMGYQKSIFYALDRAGDPIYHTNVMMALGEDYAVICLECISTDEDRTSVKNRLENTGKTVIEISLDQVEQFAGNMLELKSDEGKRHLIMSKNAYKSLSEEQIETISNFTNIVALPIPTIEKYGGGSVRCMMAEIFKPQTH